MNGSIPYGPEQSDWIKTLSPIAKSQGGELFITPPSRDPLSLYDFKKEEITSAFYQVPSTALSEKQRSKALSETLETTEVYTRDSIGFQCNFREFSHAECVKSFLAININNGGSPFVACRDCLSTLWMERNVLDYYASLWHAKWPHYSNDPDTYWGYVLDMGSTEGNLYAMWNARDYLSGKYMSGVGKESKRAHSSYLYKQFKCPTDNPNAFSPVAFYSHETHFSIGKSLDAVAVTTFYEMAIEKYPDDCPLGGEWPMTVPCEGSDAGSGAIDIKSLATLVDFFSAKGHPIIVIFNYGTTFKGAYDDVKSAGEALVPILKKNGMYECTYQLNCSTDPNTCVTRKGFWFHVDGALGAAYAPFLQMAYENGVTELKPPPIFDFRLDFVSSIVTSGHKWIGTPWPSGIYISKTEFLLRPAKESQIAYLNTLDLTLSGSRNGHSVIVLWSYISTHSYEEQAKKAITALEIAVYTERKLKELESEIKQKLWVMRAPASLAVCFKRPSQKIMIKYSLAGQWLCIDGEWRQYAHVYSSCGVTKSKIDEFVDSLRMHDAFN